MIRPATGHDGAILPMFALPTVDRHRPRARGVPPVTPQDEAAAMALFRAGVDARRASNCFEVSR